MRLRMRAASVARIVEHRRRRGCAAERLIVADIDPTSSDIGLACRQDGDGRVISMQPFGGEDVALERVQNGAEDETAGAHGIGHGRQGNRGRPPRA